MRRSREAPTALCLLAFAVMLYGCGSSGGPGEGAAAKPPPADTSGYYVTELPPPPGALKARATALSNVGTDGVVWVGGNDQAAPANAVVWKVVLPPTPSGTPTVAPIPLGSSACEVLDINEHGRAVGRLYDAGSTHAFYYDGTVTPLPDSGAESTGYAIGRDASMVCVGGEADIVPNVGQAVLWEFPALGPLPPAPTTRIPAFEGAPSGRVCAVSDVNGLRIAAQHSGVAVLWTVLGDALVPTEIGAFWPKDINSSGHVTGDDGGTAFLWQGGTPVALPTLRGYDHSEAWSLNDQGVVVGRAYVWGTAKTKAARWQSGKVVDLNKLVSVDGGLGEALGINNQGMMVGGALGSDGNLHAYLLRPK